MFFTMGPPPRHNRWRSISGWLLGQTGFFIGIRTFLDWSQALCWIFEIYHVFLREDYSFYFYLQINEQILDRCILMDFPCKGQA